jgi:hypothetical protein
MNHLEPKLVWIIIKRSVRTSKRTHLITTKIKELMLFKEGMGVCSENYMKPISTHCGLNAELLMLKQVVHMVTTMF